jgi:hypothetical protein
MTFRGDDLTTPATPDTSQAPQHGFPGSHPYTCVGRWAGLVGWLTGRLMVAGLSPINSRNLIIVGVHLRRSRNAKQPGGGYSDLSRGLLCR